MTLPLVVVGAGGFGRETLDVIEAVNRSQLAYTIIGVIDDSPSDLALKRLAARHVPWLGSIASWLDGDDRASYLVGIGNPRVRAEVARRFDASGREAATVVHPTATIGSMGSIRPGSVVCAGVQVSTNVVLGSHVHLNPSSTVGHDSVLGDYVSVNPGAIISGEVTVERGALIGGGAVVLQGLTIGGFSTVGAGACVVHDVAAGKIVKGIPAR